MMGAYAGICWNAKDSDWWDVRVLREKLGLGVGLAGVAGMTGGD